MRAEVRIRGKSYEVAMRPLRGGAFAVSLPALSGCVTWGASYGHALAMAREAGELWIEEGESRD